tara:strand:- start:4597 stop:4962 length:366 start_codon:yes stop_codon:yes gene_type:complete
MRKVFASLVILMFTFGCAQTQKVEKAKKEDILGLTLAKISKLTWGIQDLKKQGLNDFHKDVSNKASALKKQKATLKEMLESGVKPDNAIVPVTGETLLKYCKRRKVPADVVNLLKKHGATK